MSTKSFRLSVFLFFPLAELSQGVVLQSFPPLLLTAACNIPLLHATSVLYAHHFIRPDDIEVPDFVWVITAVLFITFSVFPVRRGGWFLVNSRGH